MIRCNAKESRVNKANKIKQKIKQQAETKMRGVETEWREAW